MAVPRDGAQHARTLRPRVSHSAQRRMSMSVCALLPRSGSLRCLYSHPFCLPGLYSPAVPPSAFCIEPGCDLSSCLLSLEIARCSSQSTQTYTLRSSLKSRLTPRSADIAASRQLGSSFGAASLCAVLFSSEGHNALRSTLYTRRRLAPRFALRSEPYRKKPSSKPETTRTRPSEEEPI